MRWVRATAAGTLLAFGLMASGPAIARAGGTDGAAAKKQAEEIFAGRCTPCHGPTGKGDGPASSGLVPPPRNYSDPAWQKSVTDEHIEKIIKFGGAAVGKSPTMPGNPDLMSKPQVVIELREIVRGFGK